MGEERKEWGKWVLVQQTKSSEYHFVQTNLHFSVIYLYSSFFVVLTNELLFKLADWQLFVLVNYSQVLCKEYESNMKSFPLFRYPLSLPFSLSFRLVFKTLGILKKLEKNPSQNDVLSSFVRFHLNFVSLLSFTPFTPFLLFPFFFLFFVFCPYTVELQYLRSSCIAHIFIYNWSQFDGE